MANQQLLDYIKQQIQLGVDKDLIRNTLISSGWPTPEVDEALGSGSAASAGSVTSSVAGPSMKDVQSVSASSAKTSPAIQQQSASAVAVGVSQVKTPVVNEVFQAKNEPVFQPKSDSFFDPKAKAEMPSTSRRALILPLALGGLCVVLAALSVYLFLSNRGGLPTVQPAAETGDLNEQIKILTSENQDLRNQSQELDASLLSLQSLLSFFATPASNAPSSTTQNLPISLRASVGESKGVYYLTTPENIVLTIKNSKDAKFISAIKSFVKSEAEVSGTYSIGSPSLSVQKINGKTLDEINAAAQAAAAAAAAAAASSTASSTSAQEPAAASSTP